MLTLTEAARQNWTRENLAWAAGLFEGEGCLSVSKKTGKQFVNIQIGLHERDKDVLEKLALILGGKVLGPYKPQKNATGGMVVWMRSQKEDVYAICAALFPFLGLRRQEKMLEFFEWFKDSRKRPYRLKKVV